MNDQRVFPTPQAAVDCFAETHVRSANKNKITPPLLLQLSNRGSFLKFHVEDRPYLEELWAN
jgi:hypothetical protein